MKSHKKEGWSFDNERGAKAALQRDIVTVGELAEFLKMHPVFATL